MTPYLYTFTISMSGDRYLISDQNALYFITITVVNWIDVFSRKEYRYVITNSLNYCIKNKGLSVYAWCLMSNHLHLIVRAKEGYKLSDIMRDFKKFTAVCILKKIKSEPESRRKWILDQLAFAGKYSKRIKHYKFWKDGYHAIELSSNYLIDQKLQYVHLNPVTDRLVDEPEHYVFSSARDYSGRRGLVSVEFAD